MPSFTGDWYIDGPIIAAAVLVAWATLWHRGLGPIYKAAKDWSRDQTTLREIADQFRPNGGSSLQDVLNSLSTAVHQHILDDRRAFARIERRQREAERRLVGGNDEIVKRVDKVVHAVVPEED